MLIITIIVIIVIIITIIACVRGWRLASGAAPKAAGPRPGQRDLYYIILYHYVTYNIIAMCMYIYIYIYIYSLWPGGGDEEAEPRQGGRGGRRWQRGPAWPGADGRVACPGAAAHRAGEAAGRPRLRLEPKKNDGRFGSQVAGARGAGPPWLWRLEVKLIWEHHCP